MSGQKILKFNVITFKKNTMIQKIKRQNRENFYLRKIERHKKEVTQAETALQSISPQHEYFFAEGDALPATDKETQNALREALESFLMAENMTAKTFAVLYERSESFISKMREGELKIVISKLSGVFAQFDYKLFIHPHTKEGSAIKN